ncbi:DUF7556 family protein [Natrinema halophilum]|uniref:Uncharacterized protein n=1 Tax=Natrinema halophilum TaxID=1699371 RepID=A0A7D5KCW2_9EURY|nr:hypothetical protein [Natrinema halophilum]QLG48961.1 hypothetical protein HYG82_08905 [Natrinema halophilum]
MSLNRSAASELVTDSSEVMASIDEAGRYPRFIIADITTDDAWLSTPATAAAHLDEWR